jgi:hypothetical protein
VTCAFFAYARCAALLLWPKVLDHIVIRKPKYTSLRTEVLPNVETVFGVI